MSPALTNGIPVAAENRRRRGPAVTLLPPSRESPAGSGAESGAGSGFEGYPSGWPSSPCAPGTSEDGTLGRGNQEERGDAGGYWGQAAARTMTQSYSITLPSGSLVTGYKPLISKPLFSYSAIASAIRGICS